MTDDSGKAGEPGDPFAEALRGLFGQTTGAGPGSGTGVAWAPIVAQMQKAAAIWLAGGQGEGGAAAHYSDPAEWAATAQAVLGQLPLADPARQMELWSEALALSQEVLGRFRIGEAASAPSGESAALPRSDRRFADPAWREQPFFALVHQLYLMLSERIGAMADDAKGLDPQHHAQLSFATHTLLDALSPANFALTNPVALARAAETGGQSLIDGMANLMADLEKGQLTQTQSDDFRLGETIATTAGKVVHETPLFQLIHYAPLTDSVLEIPLVIFPPWINRFYILDLNPQKSFVRWCLEQGLSVFMVSWKSADASMADVVWDDYIAAQIEAIDAVRARLKVSSVHTIGYCVAGTTLAAALAVMARREEADKVASATFFTAQVDFSQGGDLLNFVDSAQIARIESLAPEGYLDGRYLAATFNLLRPRDLIWPYVERNYLKGEGYKPFDLLHWNSDYTNLPAKWHAAYLRDLYRDNLLVRPDALSALGVPIDIKLIETPCYIQAGREDHIAPPQSVWKLTEHLAGPWTFVLAGSGHIAGVVNPPGANKYQYWTNDGEAGSLEAFIAGASEHKGSWWPHWIGWIEARSARKVPASGKRKPGGRGEKDLEDAPGRYVAMR